MNTMLRLAAWRCLNTDDGGASGSAGNGNEGGDKGGSATPRTYTQEEYDAAVKPLRKEAGEYRVKAKEVEAQLAGFKDGMTAEQAQKLKSDFAQLSDRLTAAESRALDSDIRATAKDLGFTDPSDALALIDRSALKIKDGEATNVREVLDQLKKAKPHLVGAAGSVDAGAKGKGGFSMNDLLRRNAGVG